MQLVEFAVTNKQVTMHYKEGLGYAMYFTDGCVHGCIQGSQYFFPTRKEAEKAFLWDVGYPEWTAAGEAAYRAARDKWLAKHRTLASVGAKNTTP